MCINFGRILYPFAITFVLTPTILGIKSSFFRTILDAKFFNILSRISYGVFLVHGMVIFRINWSRREDLYLSINNTYVTVLAAIVLSCILGFLLTIAVEKPLRKVFKNVGKSKTD